MFIFSPRPGTAAAEMDEDFVDPEVVQLRFQHLATLQNRISGERNQDLVGTVQEILTEGPSKKNPDMATTRTRGGKVVHVPGHFQPGLFAHAPNRTGLSASPRGEPRLTRLVAIVGPTGVGKSTLAMAVAERTGAEILSVDSMQVYSGLDVGTAKPTLDDRRRVRHHMIDVAQPEHAYTVADYRRDTRRALADTSAEIVLVVGGSGLHFRSLVDPMRFAPSTQTCVAL